MSFQDWIGEDPDARRGKGRAEDEAASADDFTHTARLREQAERESNRLRRRHRWRTRAVLLRRTSDRTRASGTRADRKA